MTRKRPHPLLRLGGAALGCVGAIFLLYGMLFFVSALASVWTNVPAGQQVLQLEKSHPLLLTVLLYPPVLIWLVYCRQKWEGRSFSSLGLGPHLRGENLGRGLAVGGLCLSFLWLLLWLSGAISVQYPSPERAAAGAAQGLYNWTGFLLLFAAVAFMEEVFFRGYLYHNLLAWLGSRAALWLQAGLFALVHMGNVMGEDISALMAAIVALPSLVLIAVLFALTYRKTGSLWFAIGFHWSWNFLLGCVFSLPVSGIAIFRLLDVQSAGSPWLSGGTFGAEGSPLLFPILVALTVLVARLPDHPHYLREIALDAEPSAPPSPAPVAEEPATATLADSRRYSSRVGRQNTFDPELLSELKELQYQREKAMAANAAREAQLMQNAELVADLAANPPVEPGSVEPEVAVPESVVPVPEAPAPVPVPVGESVDVPKVEAPVPPTVSLPSIPPAETAKPATPPPPKKPAPRW